MTARPTRSPTFPSFMPSAFPSRAATPPPSCRTLFSGGGRAGELHLHRTKVQGRVAYYGVGRGGPAVLFLHGWGLGYRAYRRAIRRLTAKGHRVYAPCLPGMGGTADLPWARTNMEGCGAGVDAFLDRMELREPLFVIGHSFGG